jgi:hypothetical protein
MILFTPLTNTANLGLISSTKLLEAFNSNVA